MGKIDTSGWKEFHMVDIGFKVYHGSRITKAERVEGDTVFLTAGFENCGVVGTIGNENIDVWEKPITVDMFGNVFYHDETCAGDDNIYAFLNSKLSRTAKLFVASSIASVTQSKYSYQQQFRQGDANELSVYLPTTPNGAPDWVYMESYMANIETRVADSLTMLQAAKDAEKKKVDTREWGEFRVGELFEKLNLRFLPNRAFDKASDISETKSEEFDLPLVNAKHSNNGIMYYGRKHEWEYEVLTIDIVADGAASTGDVYAQPQETGVLYNAYLVKPKAKCVTGLILFFLSTVIQRCVKDHFGYDNKCTWDKVKHETILLPVDKTGQPDWAYMEEYMRKVKERVKVTMEKYEMTVNEVAL